MAEREWKASGAAAATAPFEPAAVLADSVRPAGPESNGHAVSWEEAYRAATSAQRTELLALARRQGLIYAHQLPPANGHKPQEDSETLATLTRLLEGRAELQPSSPQSIELHDEGLDRMQREAVARALATPDICLIAGAAGTGKSRTVAEILTQAAARGERVLFLARRPAAIDQVLERLSDRHVLFPIRCLEAGEKPESLPPAARAATFAERVRRLREALPEALRSKQRAEEHCRSRHHEESLWPELLEAAEHAEKLGQQRAAIARHIAQVPAVVAQEAAQVRADTHAGGDSFVARLAGEYQKHAEMLAELDAAVARIEQGRADSAVRLRQVESEIDTLRSLVLARQHGRFWTMAWWRALLKGDVAGRLAECERQGREAQAAVAAAFEEMNCLQQKRCQLDDEHRAALESLRTAEICRRQESSGHAEACLAAERQAIELRWRQLVERLDEEPCRPADVSAHAVEQARARWQQCIHADEETCRFAGQWATFLQESLDALPQRLPELVNLVVATLAGLAADKHFSRGTADFDLLVTDEAEQINEAEFLRVGRRARRWVLVGNHGTEKPAAKAPLRNGRVHDISARHRTDAVAAPPPGPVSLFQRLWRLYRAELPRARHAWVREGERLCCRLQAIDAAQRKCLESERVADFPEIELRILTLPYAAPALAEVVFPASMSLSQAKEYIYRELQELPLETVGAGVCLVEDADRLVLFFGRAGDLPLQSAALEAGVSERLVALDGHGIGWRTCRLEFDKAAGWKRERAQAWLWQHCRVRDSGRALLLQTLYGPPDRPSPGLARAPGQLFAGS